MSDEAKPNKVIAFLLPVPLWLWISTTVSIIFFVAFLYYIGQQAPDQYAMTRYPPWQHTMNHKELIAYHKAIKSGAYNGDELDAKQYLYRQGSSNQLYASQLNSNTNTPRALTKGTPNRTLTMDQAMGFASRSQPINNYSFRQAQQSIALERNRQGLIDTSQVAVQIPKGIYIQTASLRSINDAGKLRQNLKERGFTPFIQEAFVKNQTWYRVRFGPYPTVSDARRAAQELKARQFSAQVVHAK